MYLRFAYINLKYYLFEIGIPTGVVLDFHLRIDSAGWVVFRRPSSVGVWVKRLVFG